MHLLETAIEQNAPLQDILMNLSMDYERLNDLMNKRESELQGRGVLIIMFVCIGLPGLIGFLVGLFTPASSGFQIEGFLSTFSLFFAAECSGCSRLRTNARSYARYDVVCSRLDGNVDVYFLGCNQVGWRLKNV